MTVVLPDRPGRIAATPRPIDGGGWQQPIAGGTTVRIERPGGTHMAVDFATPRIPLDGLARVWVSRLMQALRQSARALVPQPEIAAGSPGAPVVDGGGQSGYAVALRGLTPGYAIVEGQALNVLDSAGRAYLHIAAADRTAGSDGKVNLPIEPALRAFPADGSVCNLAAPVIEGRLIGSDKGLTLKRAKADGLQFTIEELR